MLSGQLGVNRDGVATELHAGDVVLVPAHAELRVDAGPEGATAWVTTTIGLEAMMADRSRIQPPWAG